MKKRSHYKKPEKIQKIGIARIIFLFNESRKAFENDSRLSDKYVRIARRISMKYKIKLPSDLKKKFCKNCHRFLVPGTNSRVRIHKHRIIYYCISCKHYMRHPIK